MSKSNVKVFTSKQLNKQRQENCFLDSLITDFYRYKKNDDFIDYFGKDDQYMEPNSVKMLEIYHIHILDESSRAYKRQQAEISKGRTVEQHTLKCDINNSRHDKALVYTRGSANPNYYFLIHFFTSDAHGGARDPNIMEYLKEHASTIKNEY